MSDLAKQIEQIEAIGVRAKWKVLSSSGLRFFMAIGAFAVVAPVGIVPATAIGAALMLNAIREANKQGKQAEYIYRTEIFAHVLNDKDLAELALVQGKEEVLEDLKVAVAAGQPISGAAEEYLKLSGEATEAKTVKKVIEPAIEVKAVEIPDGDSKQPANWSIVDTVGNFFASRTLTGQKPTFNPMEITNLDQLPKQFAWLREFVTNTSLVLGSQGSGKSWMVRLLAYLKKLKGYRVIIFDPHSKQSEWMGIEFYRKYEDLAVMMQWYVDDVNRLYDEFGDSEDSMTEDQWRSQLWKRGEAVAIICEEVSTYSDYISDPKLVKEFIKAATTASRKQEHPVTFVAHNLTKECLGQVPGVHNIFKQMQRLEMHAKINSDALSVAAGTGKVKGIDSDDLRDIVTPTLTRKITDFRSENEKLNDTRAQLENMDQPEITQPEPIKSAEPVDTNELSEVSIKILEFFDAAKNKEPKKLRDFDKSSRLEGYDSIAILTGLNELTHCNCLKLNSKDSWSKVDW